MNPTCTRRRPAATSASTIRRHASGVGASGFSQNTGLPAPIVASTNSSWLGPDEVTSTASTAAEAITSSPLRSGWAPGTDPATSPARAGSASATAVTWAPATARLSRRAWSWPIMPAPTMPDPDGHRRSPGGTARPQPFR